MFRCLIDTIVSLKKSLPLSELSLTFQEAFEVLRFLGIQYIWIDSICIVQDSHEDWSREAKTMMKVYQQACLNLAATVSSDDKPGLFTKRDGDALISQPFKISNGFLDGEYRIVEGVMDIFSWEDAIEGAPLNRRGWVLQERLLSPRVAHFTADQVIWDCSQRTASESVPSGLLATPKQKTFWIGRKLDSELYATPRDEAKILDEWAMMANAYSTCHLTYDSDKFIAIGGITSVFEQLLDRKFFCALTNLHLEIQLLWFCSEWDSTPPSRMDIAPSWSWASIKGAIQVPQPGLYEIYATKLFATVEDVSTQLHHHIARGDRYSGSIMLRCILNLVQVRLDEDGKKWKLTGPGTQHVRFVQPDTPNIPDGPNTTFYLVPVFQVQDPYTVTFKYQTAEVRGLLLALRDRAEATFVRCAHVGIYVSTDKETGLFPPTWLGLLDAAGEGKEALPCRSFDPEKGHLIKLV